MRSYTQTQRFIFFYAYRCARHCSWSLFPFAWASSRRERRGASSDACYFASRDVVWHCIPLFFLLVPVSFVAFDLQPAFQGILTPVFHLMLSGLFHHISCSYSLKAIPLSVKQHPAPCFTMRRPNLQSSVQNVRVLVYLPTGPTLFTAPSTFSFFFYPSVSSPCSPFVSLTHSVHVQLSSNIRCAPFKAVVL
jgi:hypothetical protein